jgi:hypothetical protein
MKKSWIPGIKGASLKAGGAALQVGSLLLLTIIIGTASCSSTHPRAATTPATDSGGPPSPEKVEQAVQQITTIINNARRWKADKHSYKELDTRRAIADGLVPKEMLNPSGEMHNPWDGAASIEPSPLPGPESFTIVFSSVPNRDCVQIALQARGKFTVFAGKWGPNYEARGEARATDYCTNGNMWFLPMP